MRVELDIAGKTDPRSEETSSPDGAKSLLEKEISSVMNLSDRVEFSMFCKQFQLRIFFLWRVTRGELETLFHSLKHRRRFRFDIEFISVYKCLGL